jgi:drug/metabolite transporter (DMT)-like permease
MRSKESASLYAYLALAAGVVIIGFSAIFVRLASAPGTVTAFYRMAIATMIIVVPFLLHLKKQKFLLPRRGILFAVVGGICFGADLAFWSAGVMLSGATNPTLLANTAPLWVGLGSMFIFKEHHKKIFWIGLVIALTGAVTVLGEDLSRAVEFGLGTFFGLLAALFYGSFHLATQQGRKVLDTLTYFSISTITSAFFLLLINIILGEPITGYPDISWIYFLALGIIVQIAGWLLLNFSQGHLAAAIISPSLLVQPVVTAVVAWLLLGELFTFWHITGGIVVLIGVLIVHRS